MKEWKSTKEGPEGVWVSEIRLKSANSSRTEKVNKLLKLLKEETKEVTNATILRSK